MSEASPSGQMTGRVYLRLVLIAAIIGAPAALLAALFLAFVHEAEHWLWVDLPDALGSSTPQWYLVIGLPVVGACVVVAARTLLPGDGGHEPLEGLGGSPTTVAFGPGVALAAVGTLAFGGVLGPEAPLIALGSVVGMVAARIVHHGPRESAVLATAGSFSAISALFGGPIVAGVLMMEATAGLGSMMAFVLIPGFVAAAEGYLIFIGLGSWGGLNAVGLVVPNLPPYNGTHLTELVGAIVVGVAVAFVISAVRRAGGVVAGPARHRLGMPMLLLGGGLAVGLLAQLASALGADSQDVLFSGQASLPSLIAEDSAKIVLILVVAKACAYAVCLGCGFRGGPVFPAIFLGVALMTLGVIWFDFSPTVAVAAGTAAGMAAMTRMLVTPMIIAALLVGTSNLDAVPAAVLAAVAGWLAIAAIDGLPQARELAPDA